MTARLERDPVYLGTSTLLVVEVKDAPSLILPEVGQVDGLRIGRAQVRQRMEFSNSTTGKTFLYTVVFVVEPEKAGEFTIPQVRLKIDEQVLDEGPLKLRAEVAPLAFHSARIEPRQIQVGGQAALAVSYQGHHPDGRPVVPPIPGLSIRLIGSAHLSVTEREGLPITSFHFEVRASELGTYRIQGITLDGVPADPVTLTVSPFAIVGTQVGNGRMGGSPSLMVGQRAIVHVFVRGLPQSTKVKLVAPQGLQITPAKDVYRSRTGETVFSFDVTATEAGTHTIATLQSPDGEKVPLPQPVEVTVHDPPQILACRGLPRSEETVVGEPFIIDYEVYFRGGLESASIYADEASVLNNPDVKVEPVRDLAYPGWSGQPVGDGSRGNQLTMLVGHGEFNGKKEQLLRFALKLTPLAIGELSVGGLGVELRLRTAGDQPTGFPLSSGLLDPFGNWNDPFPFNVRTQRFREPAQVPSHRVIEPPTEQAPPGYRGAVGTSFTFTTELDRTKAMALAPMTLTMRITGDGVRSGFKPPHLAAIDDLTRDFDVAATPGSGELTDHTITFTQTLYPRGAGVRELPPIPLVYYDYAQKKYQTVYSPRIPIEVTTSSRVGAEAISAGPNPPAGPTDPSALANPDEELVTLGANYDTLGKVATGEPLGAGSVLAILVAGPLGIVLVWGGQRVHERGRPAAAARQQRRALRSSLERVADADHFHVALAELLQAYLRLAFDLPPGEVSASHLARLFEERSVPPETRTEAEDLLTRCDSGRFASGSVEAAEKGQLIHRARKLFSALDRCVK